MGSGHTIKYKGNEISFELKKSKRKTLAISIRRDGSVIVKSPLAVKISLIKEFVSKKADWILKHQTNMKERQLVSKKYISGEVFTFLGRSYILKVVPSKTIGIVLEDDCLEVSVIRNTPIAIKTLLEYWYNEQSHKILKERFEIRRKEAEKTGLKFVGKLTIKKAKSRWGSCSSRGNIALNPILIHASPECIDYVIWHELCHLKELNHSTKFYKLLASLFPNWKEYKKKLNENIDGYLE